MGYPEEMRIETLISPTIQMMHFFCAHYSHSSLDHYLVFVLWHYLGNVIMALSDIGFGNYILTAPSERKGKVAKEAESTRDGNQNTNKEDKVVKEENSSKSKKDRRGRGRGRSASLLFNDPPLPINRKLDVSELLGKANTLTNPNAKKEKSEL